MAVFALVILALAGGAHGLSWCTDSCITGTRCPTGYKMVYNVFCNSGAVCCKKNVILSYCSYPNSCWSNGCPSNYVEVTSKQCYTSSSKCCKKADSTIVTQKPTTKPTTKPVTAKPTSSTGTGSITDGKCGVTKYDLAYEDNRIVGGKTAKQGQFPWQVQVQKYNSHWCGGTLLDDQWVVSAAHCFEDRTMSRYKFVLGQHNKYYSDGTEQTFSASKIIRHPNYVNGQVKYDIVMIKLNGRAKFNQNVRTACMPKSGENFEGQTNCIVSGWGALREGGSGPSTLNYVKKPIIPLSTCKKAYYNIYNYNICGGYAAGGKDACQGDSGGPYVCKKVGEPWKIVGVVSWGHGCARPGKYGVYSSVPYFYNWINSIRAQN